MSEVETVYTSVSPACHQSQDRQNIGTTFVADLLSLGSEVMERAFRNAAIDGGTST